MSTWVLFTLLYTLISICIVYPPTEFVTAGLTIPALFSKWLGSENAHFIQYHIKRSVLTIFIHSLIPLGYFIGLCVCSEDIIYAFLWNSSTSFLWQFFVSIAVISPLWTLYKINTWAWMNWQSHPISKNLSRFCNSDTNWMFIAADINIEYRRVDKISIQTNTVIKVVVTDNWILKVTPYTIHCAHQNDAILILNSSDTYHISQYNYGEIQFINIEVKSPQNNMIPFSIRLNSLDFKDLQDKIIRPIVILPNVKFHKTLLERFIDAFKEEVKKNVKYETEQELEPCIGCMQVQSNVKLQKLCGDLSTGENACVSCNCRPMWCVDCIAKWFASRQDDTVPETWLSSKCTCPLCRNKFCVLDVSMIDIN